VIGLLRYCSGDTFHTQRWVAPVVCLGAIDAIVSTQTGPLLPTYAILATILLFIGTWLTVVVVNNEDLVQMTITESCAGGRAKVRLAKLLLSFLFCVALGLVALFPPVFLSNGGAAPGDLVAGACAQAIAALAAVGLGALCSRPVVRRHAWSVSAGLLVGLGAILIPDGVPSRQLLVLFNRTGHVALALPIFLIGLETFVLCALAIAVSLRVSTSRS
jgi:hypothetical protein